MNPDGSLVPKSSGDANKDKKPAKQSGKNPDYALQTAGQLFQTGQLDQAIKILQDARGQNPEHFEVNYGLAIIHATSGNPSAALPLFDKAVSIRPGDSEAQFNLGRALMDIGRTDEAVAAYRRSLEINPHELDTLINLGNVLKDVNDFAGAVDCYRKTLEIKPDIAMIHINLGNVLVELGRLEEAVASYRNALGLNPNLAEAHTCLGNAFKTMDRLDDAVASHQQAIARWSQLIDTTLYLKRKDGVSAYEARIFAQRHPCDCVLSCFMQNIKVNDAMANFLNLQDAALLYDKVMTIWRHYQAVLPLQVHTVKYESLIEEFEKTLVPLLDFLGLEWDDGIRNYAATARERGQINTPSYSQVTQPLYTRARGRWQRYREHMQPALAILLPWARRLDYDE